jgi:alpha-tubulin suppressor-like RCC1 family protein
MPRALPLVLLSFACGKVLLPPDDGLHDTGSSTARLRIFMAGSGSGSVLSDDAEVDCPGTCEAQYPLGTEVHLRAAPDTTSISRGWSIASCVAVDECTVEMDRDVEVTLTFELIAYGLHVELAGDGDGSVISNLEGIDCGSDCDQDWPVGSRIRLTGIPAGASSFGGWSGDCGGTDLGCDLVIDGPKNVTAAFDLGRRSLNVTLAGSGGGTVVADTGSISCPGNCTDDYTIGSRVTLSPAPDARSQFAGWDAAECPGQGDCIIQLDIARSVTATFDIARRLLTVEQTGPGSGVITSIPSGISCPPQCDAEFRDGTIVSLSVVPNESVRFGSWAGACSGTTPMCRVTLDRPLSAIANFERVPLLAVGGAHTCALKADGSLRCWGYNDYGQLALGNRNNVGDDELPSSRPPIDIPPGIKGLCAGAHHTCVLLDAGQIRCWGLNFNGQLGLNHNQNVGDDPGERQILTDVALNASARQITCAGTHTCAVLTTGEVRCWGQGDSGQLGYGCAANIGDGTVTCASLNDSVPLGTTVEQVDAGSFHTCALLSTGAIRCWGDNEYGQLGYGHMNNLGDNPNEVGTDISIQGSVAKIFAGGQHSCALMSDSSVRCWGRGLYGQLGNNAPDTLPSPPATAVLLGSALASDMTSEDHHNCAVLTTDRVRCWGRSSEGQIGYGTTESLGDDAQDMIVDLPLQDIERAVAGGSHSCALSRSGEVFCWGRAMEGQLGYGNMMSIGREAGSLAGSTGPVSF